jgi:acyl-CoA thioesterase-2
MADDRIRARDILLDLRAVDPSTDIAAERRGSRWMWGRTWEQLPDDRVLHAAAVVYLSDMSTGFIDLDVPGLPPGGSSLDHTVYFHRPARADEWMFMALEPVSAAGARGVYRGTVHDGHGRLLATLVQENLMRPRPDGAGARG